MKLPTAMVPLIGFAPDMPPSTPGVIVSAANIVPTANGFAGAPSVVTQMPALPTACRGSAVTADIFGVRRIYAGTATGLFHQVLGAWTNVSRAGGYTDSGDNLWSFAQFGNATIAANDTDTIQAAVSGGAFANIAGAPKAKIVLSSADFVLAFNTEDATYGDQGDRWWCSAFRDHSSWAPSVTTQATTGRLIGDGGDITAASRMGSQVVAYKSRSMFVGTYVGPAAVWQWDRVPGDMGCVGPRAVCDMGGPQVFVGEDNIWMFDGTRPVPMGIGAVRDWFAERLSQTQRHKTICTFEPSVARVWIFFVSNDSPDQEIDTALVYHLARKTWGVVSIGVETAMHYVSDGVSMDSWPGTFDTLPSVSFDSSFWLSGSRVLAVFGRDHTLGALTGISSSSAFTTGDIGDDDQATLVRSVRLRYSTLPAAASVQGYTKAVSSDAPASAAAAGPIADGKFDCRQSARWHRFEFSFTGDVEFAGLKLDISSAGMR